MPLTSSQLAVLDMHAQAGDRIAFYESLASFGDPYGALALGVVRNDTSSGASANTYFLDTARAEGRSVSDDQLARISLELMLADNDIRQASGGDMQNGTWFVETIRASGQVIRANRPDTRPHLTKINHIRNVLLSRSHPHKT